MTQSVTDTSNNSLYTMLQKTDSTEISYMSNTDSFKSIIEKNQENLKKTQDNFEKTPSNISDLKNSKNSDTESQLNFTTFLKQETKESNDENSLDLTLAEDIKNFIAQFENKNINNTTENDTNDNFINELTLSENTIDINLINTLTTSEDTVDINLMNTLTTLENTALQNANSIISESDILQEAPLSENNLLLENEIDINIIDNVRENLSKVITDKSSTTLQANPIEEPEITDEILRELNVESIESETETASQGNYDLQQQSTEEHVIKAMISTDSYNDFEADMTDIQNEVQETTNKNINETTSSKIIEQVTKQLNGIKVNSKVDIVLNPESLGKVSIHVAKSPEGMAAQFTVSTNEAKEILLKNLDGLKETLLSHGINSDNVSVRMNETQKSEYKEDWAEQNNSNNKNREQRHQQKEEIEDDIFEKMMALTNSDTIEDV